MAAASDFLAAQVHHIHVGTRQFGKGHQVAGPFRLHPRRT